MVRFDQEVLGLETVRADPKHIFLKAGELDLPLGRGGHPQLLVLFDRDALLEIDLTTLDHLAFDDRPRSQRALTAPPRAEG